MKLVLTSEGFSYRTKAMKDERQAKAFAACLSRNQRFTGVQLVRNERTKQPSWLVTYKPASAERQAAIAQGEQDARAQRAAEESFTFVKETEASRPFYYCHSHKSGEVYDLDEQGCNCPDFQYRCRPAGLPACKHIYALRAAIAEGRVHNWE